MEQVKDNPGIRFYRNGDSVSAWSGFVACIGLIGAGASIAAHSLVVTSSLVLGAVVVWFLGYRALSSTTYFISPSGIGFKDVFRFREVAFDEIRSVTRSAGKNHCELVFVCNRRTVSIPLDIMNEDWFSAVRAELQKRSLPISYTAFGFPTKAG